MSSHLSSGTLLGPYELLLPLRRTGAAQVWVARLIGAGGFRSHLVLKTIPRACLDEAATEQLLLEQVTLAAQILHPNLVEAIDFGEHDDTLYVAVEWVDGQPLGIIFDEAAPRGGVPWPIAVNLVGQICRGLHAIHEHRDLDGKLLGCVHGHISLQNVVVAYNGTAKLCDFGVACAMDRLSFLTAATQRNHKLTFAAPEQLSAQPVDRRSDVFSMGTLLYQLLTSRHPFEGGEVRATVNNICSNQPAHPPGPNCPRDLTEVLLKALCKAPLDRWSNALELVEALENAMPECFHTTSDQALATYVEGLCSARKLEVHGQIHAVETRQNKRLSSLPASRLSLHPSLLAVSLDSLQDRVSEPPIVPNNAPAPIASRFSRTSLRRASRLVALPLGLLACFGLWRLGSSGERSRNSAALAGQGVSAPAASMESLPAPTPKPTTLPPAATAAAANSSAEQTPLPPAVVERPAPAPAPRRVPKSTPRRVALAPAIAVSAASATPPSVEPAADSGPLNPWDPASFGARH